MDSIFCVLNSTSFQAALLLFVAFCFIKKGLAKEFGMPVPFWVYPGLLIGTGYVLFFSWIILYKIAIFLFATV
jgi:hypothetical protein